MAQSYSNLKDQLDRVRRGWRRTAMLEGISAVVIEGAGLFLLFVLLDYMYVISQPIRVAGLAVLGGMIALLLVRQVLRPLLRVIPDEQIALYIEERQGEMNGAMMSATSLAHEAGGGGRSPIYRFIVDTVLESAIQKAGAIRIARLVNLGRLRKYALAALGVALLFSFSALRYSHFFGNHANRLLMPWESSQDDLQKLRALDQTPPRINFSVTLDPASGRILRGSALNVKAQLSQTAASGVILKFRNKGALEFHSLKMAEIDELNSFTQHLPDINDDLELFVQSGKTERDRSETFVIHAYDPLAVQSYELTLTPPVYTRQAPLIESGNSGALQALTGTKVCIRAMTNIAIKTGELQLDCGATLPLQVFSEKCARAEFMLEKDCSYTLNLTASDDQQLLCGPFSCMALPDEPPEMTVLQPCADIEVHPSAEINFAVKVRDDVGVASTELVFDASNDKDRAIQVPFQLHDDPPAREKTLSLDLPLTDVNPKLTAGDTLFYHFTVRDLKGQETSSDKFMIRIRPFEIAGAFPDGPGHEPPDTAAPALIQYIAEAWQIHLDRKKVTKADYDERCMQLAGKMRLPPFKYMSGRVSLTGLTPERRKIFDEATASVKQGVAQLRNHDAAQGVKDLQHGLALFEKISVGLDTQLHGEGAEALSNAEVDQMRSTLAFIEKSPPPPPSEALRVFDTKWNPTHRRQLRPEDAQKLRAEAEVLRQREQQIIDEATKQAISAMAPRRGSQAEPKAQQNSARQPLPGTPPDAARSNPNSKDEDDKQSAAGSEQAERQQSLQRQQEQLALQARRLSEEAAQKMRGADGKQREALEHLNNSVKAMEEAASQIHQGNLQQAAAQGQKAKAELGQSTDKLRASQFDSLDRAVAAAEELGAQIAAEQRNLRERTAELARAAEARQQKANGARPGGELKLNSQERQKLHGLAGLQAETQAKAEQLSGYMDELAHWAENSQKKDAAEMLKKTARTIKQDNLTAQMASAAVSMSQDELSETASVQQKLEETLGKVTAGLQRASHALAGTNEEKLKRALADARDLLTQAEKLGGAERKQDGGENAGPSDRHSANKDRERPTKDELNNLAGQMFTDTVRLVRRMDEDKLGAAALSAELRNSIRDEKAFHEMCADGKTPKLDNYMKTVAAVSDKLNDSLKDVLKSKRLAAAQREQTPVEYRDMVKNYYEQLSVNDASRN
jgi:hypothetical protein